MSQVIEPKLAEATPTESDLIVAVQRVLEASAEPLTLPKIRAQLPSRFRTSNLEDVLQRQVAAQVLHQYPKYRSQQDRFWDRPMPVHLIALLRAALQDGPLASSELRRKLPAYAQVQIEAVLEEQLRQGHIHRHPRAGRTGERFGLQPPNPRDYLQSELEEVFGRLEKLGFARNQIREGALELLHNEEWASPPVSPASAPSAATSETPEPTIGKASAPIVGQAVPVEPSPTQPRVAAETVMPNAPSPAVLVSPAEPPRE